MAPITPITQREQQFPARMLNPPIGEIGFAASYTDSRISLKCCEQRGKPARMDFGILIKQDNDIWCILFQRDPNPSIRSSRKS